MDMLRKMRVLTKVVQTGSFTAAASALDITPGVTSRAIAELEAHLRTRLLHRTTRSVALTEAGERYFKRAERIIAELEAAEAEATCALTQPEGTLRVSSNIGLARHLVLPTVTQYRSMNPRVMIELMADQTTPDLFEGHRDVAVIAARTLPDSRLVARKLGTTFSILCASVDYLRAKGAPTTPEELRIHDCVLLRTSAYPDGRWQFRSASNQSTISVTGPIKTNEEETLCGAIASGMGIGALPLYAAVDKIRTGAFIQILPGYRVQEVDIYALYASRVYVDAKIKTWVDYLAGEVPRILARNERALITGKTHDIVARAGEPEAAVLSGRPRRRMRPVDCPAPSDTAMLA